MKNKKIMFKAYRPKYFDNLVHSSCKNPVLLKKKQDQIVEGASKAFFKKGFSGSNMREIASASRMSIGQLYHYVSCKDDILFLVAKHIQELWYEYLVEFAGAETDNPLIRLEKAIKYSLEFSAKNKKLIQLVYTESKYLNRDHMKAILKMDDLNVSGFFRNLLRDSLKTHSMTFDFDLAAKFLNFVSLFIALRGWDLKKWSTDETVDLMVGFILRGLDFRQNS